MSGWLAIMLLASMPWNPQYLPSMMRASVVWSNTHCRHRARACYYDGTIYLRSEWEAAYFDRELRNAALHEMQHHMQCQEQIWKVEGGWIQFLELVRGLLDSGTLSEHQAGSLRALLDGGVAQAHEVHASLPVILDGHMPLEFAAWYPWFDLASWVTTPQEDSTRSVRDAGGRCIGDCDLIRTIRHDEIQPILNLW